MNSYRSSRLNTECVEAGTVGLESENLILKVQIIVSGDQGTVYMDELPMRGSGDAGTKKLQGCCGKQAS